MAGDVGAKGKAKGKGTFAGRCYFRGEWGHFCQNERWLPRHKFCVERRSEEEGSSTKHLGALEGHDVIASWRMVGNLECNHLETKEKDEVWNTIESGASENVIGPRDGAALPGRTLPWVLEGRHLCGSQRDCHAEHRGETRGSVHTRWMQV